VTTADDFGNLQSFAEDSESGVMLRLLTEPEEHDNFSPCKLYIGAKERQFCTCEHMVRRQIPIILANENFFQN